MSSHIAYQLDNQQVPVQPDETACYRLGTDFIVVDPNSYFKYHNNPDYIPCILSRGSSEPRDLPVGTCFQPHSPLVKIVGYYSPLQYGEQPVVYVQGMWCDISTQETWDWANYPGACLGVRRVGRLECLPQGSRFNLEPPVNAPPVESSPQNIIPEETPCNRLNSAELPSPQQFAPAPAEPCENPTSKPLLRHPEETKQPILTSQSVPRPRPSHTCSSCKNKTEEGIKVLSVFHCFDCLLYKFETRKLSSLTGSGMCDWNAELIYQLWTNLREILPPEGLLRLPQQCPLPHDSEICEGKHVPVAPNYPPTGHIVGSRSICSEESCPDHKLCRACANSLRECPRCGHIITFEEPRDCECASSSASIQQPATFDTPCSNCGKKLERRKEQRPPSLPSEL